MKVLLMCGLVIVLAQCGRHSVDPEERPMLSALPKSVAMVINDLLVGDCTVGIEELRMELAAADSGIEDALWEAYELGPTVKVRDQLHTRISERWLLRHRWLESYGRDVIGSAQTQELLAVSEEEFRIEEDVKQVTRWREVALGALGLVCTERSFPRLRAIADDPRSPTRGAAELSLRSSANCSSQR